VDLKKEEVARRRLVLLNCLMRSFIFYNLHLK